HIAIVVENIEESLGFWQDALGLMMGKIQNVPQEEVQVAFLDVGESHIELVQPTTEDSGIAKFLAKKGQGMHHICLEVEDIAIALEQMKSKGVDLINETAREREGRKYAFIHPKSTGGVLVELY